MAKLTESMLRSIIQEELSKILDEAMSEEEKAAKREKEKRERANKLRKFRPKTQGYKGFQRDRFDSDDPEAKMTPKNPGMSRDGN
jgi:hypothetical protein